MRARLDELTALAAARGTAVGAFTCYELATADAIIAGAERAGLPVVLLVPPAVAARPRGMRFISALRALADAAEVGVVVQLDHASDPELISAAVAAGADAVLADGSHLGLRANTEFVAEQLRALEPRGAVVEAELGALPGDEDRATPLTAAPDTLTDPADAERFAAETGVRLLAVAVGNVHGAYRGEPRIDRDRLSEIRDRVGVPLVLHGASGIPADALADAVALGVAKVNINTELRGRMLDTWTAGLPEARDRGDDVASLTARVADAVCGFVAESLAALGSGHPTPHEGDH